MKEIHTCTFKPIAYRPGLGTVKCIGCGAVALVKADANQWERRKDAMRRARTGRR